MPFRSSKYKPRKYGRKTNKVRTYKTAKATGSNVAKLQKQVNSLRKAVGKVPQKYVLGSALAGQFISRDYIAINLNNYSSLQTVATSTYGETHNPGANPIFGGDANDLLTNRITDSSFALQLKIRCAAETDNVTYTMFLVSLKDEANDGTVYDPITGQLTLTPGSEYYASSTASGTVGMVLLNKKTFNIHKRWQFTIGNNGASLATASARGQLSSERMFYIKRRLNQMITSSTGNVFGQRSARDPSKQYYLIMFNDDNTVDFASQAFELNMVRTVKVYE